MTATKKFQAEFLDQDSGKTTKEKRRPSEGTSNCEKIFLQAFEYNRGEEDAPVYTQFGAHD